MKYLKRFNESNVDHFKPLIDGIKDVLADVVDIGFDIYLLKDPNGSYTDPSILNPPAYWRSKWSALTTRNIEVIRVQIEHNPPEYSSASFKYKDIKDSINHLIGYMGQEFGYNDFVYRDKYTLFNDSGEWVPNKLPRDNEDVGVIGMMFYKLCEEDTKMNESITDTIDAKLVRDIVTTMKHLKTYKIFESEIGEDVISDLKYMLLDISDTGLNVETNFDKSEYVGGAYLGQTSVIYIRISCEGTNKPFIQWSEIEDTVIRIHKYLSGISDNQCILKYEINSKVFAMGNDFDKKINRIRRYGRTLYDFEISYEDLD